MSTIRTLLAPLNYLRSRNSQKFIWDWTLPATATLIAVVVLLVLPKPVSVLGDRGLIYWINELLQILIGFYIAALAAISSFGRAALDQVIEGEGVVLKMSDGERKSLTRRAFLSLMFGYLSLLAIGLYCVGLVVVLLTENIRLIPREILDGFRLVFVAGYIFAFVQMMAVTLIALFYLSDRIHRQTPVALPPEKKTNG